MANSNIINSYHVEIGGDAATVTLDSDVATNLLGGSRMAVIDFSVDGEPAAFINRGGFLTVRRPIELLGPMLDVLRNESPIHLAEDGTLSTEMEPIGEGERELLEPSS